MNSLNGLPAFDPNPSLQVALEILQAAASQFALIGRVATWVYLDSEMHQYTKDVDIAVFYEEITAIETEVSKRQLTHHRLQIGGIGVRDAELKIDFIDRREFGINTLFQEAIEQASAKVSLGDQEVPVVSLEHLIAMKMVSGEPKDDKDAKDLLSVKSLAYSRCREIVERFLGPLVATRLDVFAREMSILPKRGPYLSGS